VLNVAGRADGRPALGTVQLCPLGFLDASPVAVDVTPERDGESPDTEVRALLEDNGFTVRRKDSARFWGDSILFGKNC